MSLHEINHPHLTPSILTELKNRNVATCSAFVTHNPGLLSTKCKLTLCDILDIREIIFDTCGPSQLNLTTYRLHELTNPLLPPFKSDRIYEFYGPPGCGKTQLAMFLTAHFARQDKGVVYIDTKNDFSLSRLMNFLVDKSKLSNIKLAKAFDLHEMLKLTDH